MNLKFMDCFFAVDREDRYGFIQSHFYTAHPQKIPTINAKRRIKMKRRALIKIYSSCFNMDSVYEYFVFREVISRINDAFEFKKPRATLGHWIPLSQFGNHHVNNWVIQSRIDNNEAGDEIPTTSMWTYDEQIEQIEKILSKCDNEDGKEFVRESYKLLQEVYHG